MLTLKILVADDEVACRAVAVRALAKFCPEAIVDEAPDGMLAAALVVGAHRQCEPYRLVCLDCHMPEMGGPEAAQLIRQYEAVNHLEPVTLCVISSDESARQLFVEQLGDDPHTEFIAKPLALEHLLRLYRFLQLSEPTPAAARSARSVRSTAEITIDELYF